MTTPNETRGWEIVKTLNAGVNPSGTDAAARLSAIDARRLLAEYFKLDVYKPSRLHSAILSCAVKMAQVFPDFHFVAFLDMWGLENLRSEDGEARVDESGKRFPSLSERLVKAYAYSLMFFPEERLPGDMEDVFRPVLSKKGYVIGKETSHLELVCSAIAVKVFTSEVRNRKMTFVQLLLPNRVELVTEVHTLTTFSKMRYQEIEGRMFDIILRTSDSGNLRVEAAILSRKSIGDVFNLAVGYIEHIDINHHHIHVFDNLSRHLVSQFVTTNLQPGQYVEFVPIIPKEGNFKMALITRVLDNGPEAFGYRNAIVTYANEDQGYAVWELLPDEDGQVRPIIESGAKENQQPATNGYISKRLCDSKRVALPKKGDKLQIVTFLKRSKDGNKKPFVVDFR